MEKLLWALGISTFILIYVSVCWRDHKKQAAKQAEKDAPKTFDIGRATITVTMPDGVVYEIAIKGRAYRSDYLGPIVSTVDDRLQKWREKCGAEGMVCVGDVADKTSYIPLANIKLIEVKFETLVVTI